MTWGWGWGRVQEEFFTLLNVCNKEVFKDKAVFLGKYGELKVRIGRATDSLEHQQEEGVGRSGG